MTRDRPRRHRQHGERRDERRQLPVRDEETVHQTARDARRDGQQHREHDRHPRRRWRSRPARVADSAATEPTDRSMPAVTITKVDAERQDRGDGGLDADVEQVVRR